MRKRWPSHATRLATTIQPAHRAFGLSVPALVSAIASPSPPSRALGGPSRCAEQPARNVPPRRARATRAEGEAVSTPKWGVQLLQHGRVEAERETARRRLLFSTMD